MGQYVDLLRSLPKTRRDVGARRADKSPEVVAVARQYGREYFDGDRKYGYGGYSYDGRWRPVARDIRDHYRLHDYAFKKHLVLDVGCAKGFLVDAFWDSGVLAFGIDLSSYAVKHCPSELVGYLHVGLADDLPFPDDSFDLVLSINTLHNLPRPRLIAALREVKRVSRGRMFVQVDSYRTAAEKALFEEWVLTAEFHGYPDDWLAVFEEAGYDGDYAWTILEADD